MIASRGELIYLFKLANRENQYQVLSARLVWVLLREGGGQEAELGGGRPDCRHFGGDHINDDNDYDYDNKWQ